MAADPDNDLTYLITCLGSTDDCGFTRVSAVTIIDYKMYFITGESKKILKIANGNYYYCVDCVKRLILLLCLLCEEINLTDAFFCENFF